MKYEFNEEFLTNDARGNSFRLYLVDDIWLVLEQRNAHGTFLTGFLSKDEAVDFLYEVGADIEEIRPSELYAEHW